jgi:hypothetical protein
MCSARTARDAADGVGQRAAVASARALATTYVCEPVLDLDTLARSRASLGGPRQRSKLLLEGFIVADLDVSAGLARGVDASGTQRTAGAGPGRERDRAHVHSSCLALRTCDGLRLEVKAEVALRELPWAVLVPRLRDHGRSLRAQRLDLRAAPVPSVDLQFRNVCQLEIAENTMLRLVRRPHVDVQDQSLVHVRHQVPLVPVDHPRLRFPAMAHVGIGDRDASVLRDAASDPGPAARGVGFEVLFDHLPENVERLLQRGLGDCVRGVLLDPGAELVGNAEEPAERIGLGVLVAPVDVE